MLQAQALPTRPLPQHRPYQPFGRMRDLLLYKGGEIMLAGPAGTGKSRANLEKVHLCAERYPGMRALIVRKTRVSLSQTGLVTLEDHVLPEGHAALAGAVRTHRSAYRYPNGSEIVIGGMDNPVKVMSAEYDLIYVQEATELAESDWEQLTTRLRNGRMPYQQIIGDCNPGPPTHWIKQRADRGDLLMLDTRHQDNPVLYDHKRGEWSEKGAEYLTRLRKLTGVRKRRLYDGEWAAAEGAVYEDFDRSIHLIDRGQVPELRRRWRVHDFGFTNPYVCQWWGEDADGRLYLYREIYFTRRLVEDHAKTIARHSVGERIEADICDHDAEDRATLERHLGVRTTTAYKAISTGIEAVQSRLRPAGDGKPRLYFVRDALVERDDRLADEGLPWCSEQEMDSYAYPTGQDGKPRKEEPVDKDNHGMDAMRYMVAAADKLGSPRLTIRPATSSSAYNPT